MTVVLAEDSLLLREGLVRLLDEVGATVVAAVGDGVALVEAVDEHRPEVAVVDVRMPPSFTDEGLRAALEHPLEVPGHEDPGAVPVRRGEPTRPTCWRRAAASATCSRTGCRKLADLSDALDRVAAGGTVLDPEVVSALFTKRRRKDPLAELSPREREVIGLMAEGRTNTAIGRDLVVTQGAVEKHISSIFTKLGLPPSGDDHRRVMAVLAWLEG